MNIFKPTTWFGEAAAAETKASAAAPIMVSYNLGQPLWTPNDYGQLTQESYLRNAVAYRCVKMIAQACAQPQLMLRNRKTKELVDEHPLIDLLNRPRPMCGAGQFFEGVYSYLLLAGQNYHEAVGPTNKPPLELWLHRPDRMKVVPGKFGLPQAYEYERTGRTKRWPVSPRGESKILHVKEFHPANDWYGLSHIEPAGSGVDRSNGAAAHNKALLDNGARPAGALIFTPITTGDGTSIEAPQEALDAAEEQLKKLHTGPSNAGQPMVLGGNVKWQELGLTPRDMDFDNEKQDAGRDICLALGVPPVLIIRGDATYNNVKEAKLELTEETVLPLVELELDELNHWLLPMFDDKLELAADLDSIPALELRREVRRKSVTELVAGNVISADEAREELGYGPRPDAVFGKPDPSLLKALMEGVELTGPDPLHRYLLSVGLIKTGTTVEAMISTVADFLAAITEDDGEGDEGATTQEEEENDV